MEVRQSDFYTRTAWENRDLLAAVKNHEAVIVADNGRRFRVVGAVNGGQLEAGMKVLAAYAQYNVGADIVEVVGLTGWSEKYGEGGVEFDSVKEVKKAEGVTSLQALEAKQREREYGYHTYLYLRDIGRKNKAGDPEGWKEGPWYYLFEGRWSRGSGAERLSFVLLEEV